MNVLLIGSDNPVGELLHGSFARWGRHQARLLSSSSARWSSERQAKKAVRKDKPDAVVDLSLANRIAAGETPDARDIERIRWVAKACEHSGMRYLMLSSDQVYAGLSGRALRETDKPDAYSEPGFQCVDAENRVKQAAPSALILRMGPLFAGSGDNSLTRLLGSFASMPAVTLDETNVYCPVSAADAARVIAAVVDQLSAGAQASGVYHYASGDRTTEFGFGETALAAASQYSNVADVVLHPQETEAGEQTETRVLDCSRLRDTFAIKQVPWRGSVNEEVRRFYSPESSQ